MPDIDFSAIKMTDIVSILVALTNFGFISNVMVKSLININIKRQCNLLNDVSSMLTT